MNTSRGFALDFRRRSNMQLDFACLPDECLRSSDSLIRCEGFVKNVICLDNLKRALDMRDKQCVFILVLVYYNRTYLSTYLPTARWPPQINCESMIN